MADRDTTATPYELSGDGICYFGFPDGNAPVSTVASYAELRTKGQADADNYGFIYVADPYIEGKFTWSDYDPHGNGDDGGLVIAASGGGWWVRQFSYKRAYPIELDWFEGVVNNADITALFKRLAQDFTPYFYVRVPSRALKLIWSNGTATVDWSVTYGIQEFRLFESNAQVEIYIAAPDNKPAWQMNVSNFLLGSSTRKATYNDYTLTFTSTWTFDNRLFTDAVEFLTPPPAIQLTMSQSYAISGTVRCNSAKLQGNLLYLANGCPLLDFKIGGKYRYSSGVNFNGPGVFDVESAYNSDECARKPGWTGTTAGLVNRNIGLARSGGIGGVVTGTQAPTTRAHIKGEIICQYGGGSGFLFWDYIGTSINDPLIIRSIDRGFTGPNEFGKPAGVQLQQNAGYQNHVAKSDGFGKQSTNETNKRFFKLIGESAVPFTSGATAWLDEFFMENNQADDVPGAGLTYTQHVTFIVVNCRGNIWQENGPLIQGEEQPLDNIHFMGDGVNPAWIANSRSSLHMGKLNSLKYAKVDHVEVTDVGNVLDTVNCTDFIKLYLDATVTADKLTFSGTARNIINFSNLYGNGSPAFTVTNLNAPVGSTVTQSVGMTAVFTLNGTVRTLPYTIVVGDNGAAVPDIPPNPLLGVA